MEDLGTLGGKYSRAYGINDLGQVVGSAEDATGQTQAFIWTRSAGMKILGTLGGTSAHARAINNKGKIVGTASLPNSSRAVGFLWTPEYGMKALPDLGGQLANANTISDEGLVGGGAYRSGENSLTAVLWEDRKIRPIAPLGAVHSTVTAIGPNGEAFGESFIHGVGFHAFRWTNTLGFEDLYPATGMLTIAGVNRSLRVISGQHSVKVFRQGY